MRGTTGKRGSTTNKAITKGLREEVLDRIEESKESLADLCLELGNTFAPVGHEQPLADAVSAWYSQHEISSFQQMITPERSNVIARLPGDGSGRSLIFNAHLDTELSGPDYERLMDVPDPNQVGGWRDGDQLFGHTILNDRGLMAVFMVMGKVIRDLKVPLTGDILLTSVAGETGQAPVDEYQGLSYEGKGFGSRYLVDHGIRADYALVAEATSWGLSWVECGACYIKITLRGRNMYTPRLIRTERLADHPNALVKGAEVIRALEAWAIDYENRNAYESPCGEVRPKAQVGAVRGGIPYRPNRSSTLCNLYLDVRTIPGADPLAVLDEVRSVVQEIDPAALVECYMAKAGCEGVGVEPLAEAVTGAFESVMGGPPPPPEVAVTSMWRDTNVFNSVGIPSLTFGTGRGTAHIQGTGSYELDDLVACAKIYALTAMELCA
ncbi:MAG: peptidase dimerization domain-containing protein [Acidobacteria bacterium]|nr:peptidase dimerization domain-containing protein [Acidobacteriota bacterium]